MMGIFFCHMVKSAVVMTLLYLGYKLLLANTTFFRLNRYILLLIPFISFLAPLLEDIIHFSGNANQVAIAEAPIYIGMVAEASSSAESAPLWPIILVGGGIAGMLVVAIYTLFSALRLQRLISGGEVIEKEGKYRIIVNADAPGPFSWGKYIVVRPEDCDSNLQLVLQHEKAHINLHHWIDLLWMQCVVALQWFSPASWLLMRELKQVHEYQADASIPHSNRHDYQIMLLKKTVGSSLPTFTDSLNHSQLKTRLTMMMTKKSKRTRALAALMMLPLTLAGTLALSYPSFAGKLSLIEDVSFHSETDSKVNESVAIMQSDSNMPESSAVLSAILPQADSSATVDNETESISASEVELSSDDKKSQKDDFPLIVFVDGKRYDGEIREIEPGRIKSMTVVKDDPEYPKGKIMITLLKDGEKPEASPNDASSLKIHHATEEIAEYKGGQKALMTFLAENIKYPGELPKDEQEKKAVRRVIVRMEIDPEGKIGETQVLKSGGEAFDNEALRVVKLTSGNWIPGKNDGKPVSTYFVLPVNFKAE